MSLAQTKAAAILQEKSENLSSHQVISLMMDGALERVGQAQECLQSGNEDDAALLAGKLAGIIGGLRASLNMDAGGEIAVNLDALYAYMAERLAASNGRDVATLSEVQRLIGELKLGWDAIDGELAEAC